MVFSKLPENFIKLFNYFLRCMHNKLSFYMINLLFLINYEKEYAIRGFYQLKQY